MKNIAFDPCISVSGLPVRMPVQVAKVLVAEIIKIYSNSSQPQSAQLRELIQANVVVQDAAEGIQKANPGQVRRALEKAWFENPVLSASILSTWSDRHQALNNVCLAFMKTPSVQMDRLTQEMKKKGDYPAPVALAEIVYTIEENHPGIGSVEDIWLAAALALLDPMFLFPQPVIEEDPEMETNIPGESKETEHAKTDGWDDILGLLRSISPDAPRWQTFDVFLQAASDIAGQKREAFQRQRQAHELTIVFEHCHPLIAEQAAYFEIAGTEIWSSANVSDERVGEAAQILETLHHKLEEFKHVKDSLSRSQRFQSEEQIVTAYEAAHNFFSGSPAAALPIEVVETPEASVVEVIPSTDSSDTNGQSKNTAIEQPGNEYQNIVPTVEEVVDENPVAAAAVEDAPLTDELPGAQTGAGDVMPESLFPSQLQAIPVQEKETRANDDPMTASEASEATADEMAPDQETQAELGYFEETDLSPVAADTLSPLFRSLTEEEVEDQEPVTVDENNEWETSQAAEEFVMPFTFSEQTLPTVNAEEANEELLRRLSSHDLSSAYWLAWANEQLEETPSFPSWLIAAMQGAVWSIGLWPEQTVAFQESVSEIVQPDLRLFEDADHLAVFGLAVGLHFNLINPTGSWSAWLEARLPGEFPGLSSIMGMIAENNHRGIVLDPRMVQLIWNREKVEQHAKDLSSRVNHWLRTAGEKGARIIRAAKVWQEMVRPGRGELYKWLDYVARDQRAMFHEVETQLNIWSDRSKISLLIHQLDQQLNGHHSRPIDGEARDQIIGWVSDICALAREWCSAVGNLKDVHEGKVWAYDQTRQLCEKLQLLLQQAITDMPTAAGNTNDPLFRVSFHMVEQVLLGMKGMIIPGQNQALHDWVVNPSPRPDNLQTLLTRSLLLYPGLDLDSSGMPMPGQAADLRSHITTFRNRTVEDAMQGWISLHDYRFTDILLEQISSPDLAEKWETRVRDALRQDVQRLERSKIPETIVAIEQALLETLIAEGEYTGYVSAVESVRKQIRQSEFNGGKHISIQKLSKRLDEIREELKVNRSKRLARHEKHWEELRNRLSEVAQDAENFLKIEPYVKSKIEEAVDKSFREGDLRAAGEYLAHLDASLALPVPKMPEEAIFETIQDENPRHLAEFISRMPDYVQMFKPRVGLTWSQIINEIKSANSTLLDIPTGSLPGPRRQEAANAMESWRQLKGTQIDEGSKLLTHVATLMKYLGFEVTSPSPVSISNLPPGMRDYQLWRVSASAGVFAPVAQFGSQRKGYYQVLGVWNRPGMETLGAQVSALMQKTGDEPTIVFYFHILTSEQRRLLFSVTHHNKLPILVIDEALILHLARERETRLRTMFACTLPFAALNPYFPAAAGLVPPEVFKGRGGLVRELINPQGPVIIYGGRQLGKSALLRQVEREFHHPQDGQFVIYEDIKLVGAVGTDKDYQIDLRDRLAPKLVALGLLDSASASEDIGNILLLVEQRVKSKRIQFRLLLDETDNFLSADALRNFPVVQKLKNAMEQTDHAFKFILAGLHNVQRFGRIPNHPLAHLGDPIQIGPLPPRPARDLLMEPLHALGFHFGSDLKHEDTSLPLHILSYTNRHPGLIQYFGHALVKHMLEKHQQPSQPPLCITRADVEQVYRKKEVRDKICERFNLTLDLDPRYTAITLVMILEQWEDQNGFDRLYSAQQLRERATSWWAEAFGEEAITPEGFKGILEEMVGLGVLAVSQDENSFRLRSPNLVYLMGTHEEIWDRMARLSGTVPPGQSALNSHHARLENLDFSPFTFGQERVLNSPRSGVALIFGSNASGYGNLQEALRRLPVTKNRLCRVRIMARGADAILQQLKQSVREHPESGLLIAHREMEDNPDKMAEEVQAAIQYCTQVKDPILRVCFSFDPQAAWQWFQLPGQIREQIEERALVMSLQCWDRIGVQQRLEMETSEGMVPDRLLTRVVEATGGWLTLLDTYIMECRNKEPAAALDLFQQIFRAKESSLTKQFVTELGIYERLPRELIGVLLDPQLKQMVKEEPTAFLDLLEMMIKGQSKDSIKNTVEYLQRLSIIVNEQYPDLEPVVGRCWNAA